MKARSKAQLDGRILLISGASTGIGRAAALDFARLGARVYAGVRSKDAGHSIESEGKGLRGRLSAVSLDVTEDASSSHAISTIIAESGRIDGLVNNAGIAVAGPCEILSLDDYRVQFEVNVLGAVRLTQLCLPHLRRTKGRIAMISSVNGKIASPFLSAYAASKFALEGFSDSLRREMEAFGVRVTIIEPGPIQTPIWEKATIRADDVLAGASVETKAVYEEPVGRFRVAVERAAAKARPIEDVLKALRHAFCDDAPRSRYVIGRDNQIAVTLSDFLPDRLMDTLLKADFSRRSK